LAKNGFPLIIYFFLFFFSGVLFQFYSGKNQTWILVNPGNAGMVPRENLEESVVRTGRDFPAGGNPCLSKGLTSVHALQFF